MLLKFAESIAYFSNAAFLVCALRCVLNGDRFFLDLDFCLGILAGPDIL